MLGGILFIVGALCCARYSFQYFIVVRFMRQPYCHIAAVGHAFVLFDFLRSILSEVGIGEVGKEVGKKIVIDGFVGVDVFGCHSFLPRIHAMAALRISLPDSPSYSNQNASLMYSSASKPFSFAAMNSASSIMLRSSISSNLS